MSGYKFFHLALSEAGLAQGWYYALGLPEPTLMTLTDHSATSVQAQGGQARHGYRRAVILWSEMLQGEAAILRRLILATEATYGIGNGVLWATVPRTTADSPGQDWVDVYGIAMMPEFGPMEGGAKYQNVQLELNNITIDNDPSGLI